MLLEISRSHQTPLPVLETAPNSPINILSDNLSASFPSHTSQAQPAVRPTQCVRCTTPLFPNFPASGIAYFEVVIKQKGQKGAFYIGVTDKSFQLTKTPGSTRKSYAMRWDGKPHHANSYSGAGPSDVALTTGSVVGCGMDFDKREIFFTYNGRDVGTLFSSVEVREYYATVSLGSNGEQVAFVLSPPFVYDLEGRIRMESNRTLADINDEVVPPDRLHDLIHDFLFHEGYADTLMEFDRSAGYKPQASVPVEVMRRTSSIGRVSEIMEPILMTDTSTCGLCGEPSTSKVCENCLKMIVSRVEPSSPVKLPISSPPTSRKSSEAQFALRMERCDSADLSSFYLKDTPLSQTVEQEMKDCPVETYEKVRIRGEIRRLICVGEVDNAIRRVNELFPDLLANSPPTLCALCIQQFIELVGQQQIYEAVLYARKHLTEFRRGKVRVRKDTDEWVGIEEVLGLLCYVTPETSPVGHLLHQNQRELTADILNNAILGRCYSDSEGQGVPSSRLEVALQELVAGAQIYQRVVRKSPYDTVEIEL